VVKALYMEQKFFNNMMEKVVEDLRKDVIPGSKVSIAAVSFLLYAFKTSWTSTNEPVFNLSGGNMDEIYESIVRTAGAANPSYVNTTCDGVNENCFSHVIASEAIQSFSKNYILQSKQNQKIKVQIEKLEKNLPTKSNSIAK
jgi:nitrate/TMAO reductase-like tetraheme cytochrome c subunit